MVRFERCCCCTVKTGSIVLGALMLVGSVLSIGDSAKDILNGGSKLDLSDFDLTYYQQHRLNTLSYYLSLANVALNSICIIISSLLIYGVNKENPKLVKPMVIFLPLDSAVRLIFIILICTTLGLLHPASLALNFLVLLSMIFNIFVWLCIYSHYQQLNEGSDGYAGNEMKPV